MIVLGFLLVGPAGPMFGTFSTTEIGVAGLWIAALLTLITGYDYLRAGLRYVEVIDADELVSKPEATKPTSDDIG